MNVNCGVSVKKKIKQTIFWILIYWTIIKIKNSELGPTAFIDAVWVEDGALLDNQTVQGQGSNVLTVGE